MSTDGDGRYERPRIYAAGVLVVTACLLLVFDAVSAEYMAGDVTIGTLLVVAGSLLGVELGDVVRRR